VSRVGLGCLSGGSLYHFAAMGEFASHDEAVRHFEKLPRSGDVAVTVETIPCVRHGIEYGYRHVVRNMRGQVLDV
jgi:hypothetical protein